jgi:hypothetical protein
MFNFKGTIMKKILFYSLFLMIFISCSKLFVQKDYTSFIRERFNTDVVNSEMYLISGDVNNERGRDFGVFAVKDS